MSFFLKQERARILFVISIVFLLFFRARWAFGVFPGGDDACYVDHLNRFLNLGIQGLCPQYNYFSPAAPLLWIPVGGIAALLAQLSGIPVVNWLLPLLALFSFSLWGISLFLLCGLLKDRAIRWSLVFLLNVPLLYYAAHKSLMVHTTEMALALATIFFLERKKLAWALLLAIGLACVRYNDFPVLGMILAGAWTLRSEKSSSARTRVVLAGGATVLVTAGIFWLGWVKGYRTTTFSVLYQQLSWKTALHTFFGPDWGLFWTAPLWLLIFGAGAFFFRALSLTGKAAMVWLAIDLLLCISWAGNGGDFGYRYLIGSYAACLWIGKELFALRAHLRPLLSRVALLGAAGMTYLTLVYKTTSPLGPHPTADSAGFPFFLLEAMKAVADPDVFKTVVMHTPLPTLGLSWGLFGEGSRWQRFAIHEPGTLLLALVTLLCLTYVILFTLSELRTARQRRSARQSVL